MELDLREFEEFPARAVLVAKPGEFEPFADEITAVDEVKLALAIQKSHEEFFCQGTVTATYTVECARCLEPFEYSVSWPVDFIVCNEDAMASREDGVIDDEEYVLIKGTDLRADVRDPVRQALTLSLGMKPLCSEDCRGLCPKCGVNRNEQECNCKQDDIDPRWEGLQRLSGGDR
jgi:uncharacterized protein